jgi:hypothetical protein
MAECVSRSRIRNSISCFSIRSGSRGGLQEDFFNAGGDAVQTPLHSNRNFPMSTLSIRLPNSLHQHAKRLAQTEGVSVNQLVSSALAEKLSALDAERYLNERATRGRDVDINVILAKVPNTEPELKDRIVPDLKHP